MTTYRCISAEQAIDLIASDPAPTVFDVRDAAAYQRSRLPSAAHLTQDRMPGWFRKLAKDQAVVIYCYHGNASKEFAQMFVDFRFTNVYSVDGGFEALNKLAAA